MKIFVLALASCFVWTGCRPKQMVKKTAEPGTTTAVSTTGPEVVPPPDAAVKETNIRGSEFVGLPDLQAVHFDFDRYELTRDSREALQKNASYLKDNPEMHVLVEGHCDERGTIEYNLALGQKRAKAVREYYMRLGVPGNVIATISYGEEKPVCQETTESCWAQNRRGETKVRGRTASNGKAGTPHP